MKRGALATLVFASLLAAEAGAVPSVWQRARNPERARAQRALVDLERWTLGAYDESVRVGERRGLLLGAVAMAELRGAAQLPDVRIKFLLGEVLADYSVQREDDARALLEAALAEAPNHPLAAAAWATLAELRVRLGAAAAAYAAFARALERTWRPNPRAHVYGARAGLGMQQGDAMAAIRDFRRALRVATVADLVVILRYGLAVALERSGDLPAALRELKAARALKPKASAAVLGALELPEVRFVPSYEFFYYKGLEAMAEGRFAESGADARLDYRAAADFFAQYLEHAEPATPWVGHAERLRAACERELSEEGQSKGGGRFSR